MRHYSSLKAPGPYKFLLRELSNFLLAQGYEVPIYLYKQSRILQLDFLWRHVRRKNNPDSINSLDPLWADRNSIPTLGCLSVPPGSWVFEALLSHGYLSHFFISHDLIKPRSEDIDRALSPRQLRDRRLTCSEIVSAAWISLGLRLLWPMPVHRFPHLSPFRGLTTEDHGLRCWYTWGMLNHFPRHLSFIANSILK